MHSAPKGLVLACAPLALLAACSSSDSDDSTPQQISSLTAPEGVSVVEPDTSDVSTGNGSFPNAGNEFPIDSDYVTDGAAVRVIDPSVEAVETANGIMCQVGLTRFSSFVNEPAYTAQVDTALCGDPPEISESGAVTPDIHVFTMDVDRESNTAPQVASLWLPLENNGGDILIHAQLTVTASPSTADRYGAFELNYAGVPDGGTLSNPAMFGVLFSTAGNNGFSFYEGFGDVSVPAANPGDEARLSQLVLTIDPVSGEGAAKITQSYRENTGSGDSGLQESSWLVVFDNANVVRQFEADAAVALSRGDYVNHVYRYNLYHNQGDDLGQRVSLNSGINVELSTGAYAWIGYHGAWAPSGESFNDGDVVTAETPDGIETYDVLAAPGRLKRVTRDSLLLTELGTQRFEWWEVADRHQVAYSGTEWQRMATWNDSTESWDDVTPPTMIDVSAEGGYLQMYSEFLGGVNYTEAGTAITFFTDELVDGSDPVFTGITSLDLYATVQAIKSDINLVDANAGNIYLADAPDTANPHHYVFDPSDMSLIRNDGGTPMNVGLATGVEPDQGPNQWGLQSGPLVTAAQLTSMTNIYDVYDESTFYFYETGHNTWNQYIGLTDSMGEFVTFDPPLDLLYTHATANDMNGDTSYDGQQLLLSYNGPGRLFGIPGSEQDLGGEQNVWLPEFSLSDGTEVGANSEYIVRALGVDQTLVVDAGGAPQLDITDANALVLPDASTWVAPAVGSQPVVTDPPAVIDGVIQ